MGSLINGITGLLSGGGGSSNNSAGSIAGLGQVAGEQQQLAGQFDTLGNQLGTQGTDIFGPAFGQYGSGISGTLTPAQSSLVKQNLGAMDASTAGTYGNLGLGGSTMETQDQNANSLRSLSEQANLDFQNESLGLQGLDEALKYFGGEASALGGAGTALGGASTSLGRAGELQNQNTAELDKTLAGLGNALTNSGGLGSGISSLLGKSGAGGAGSAIAGQTALAGGGVADAGAAGGLGGGLSAAAGTDLTGIGLGAGAGAAGAAGAGLLGAGAADAAATGGAAALGASPAIADLLPFLLLA